MAGARSDDRSAPTAQDLELLEAAVALTPRRISVPIGRVFEQLHGRPPGPRDLVELRLAVLRLERDGLLQSDLDLAVEPTPDGQVAVELLRAGRAGRPSRADPRAS